MKVCVLTPLYAIAGVPLAQLRFARVLAARGYDVDLVIGRVEPQYVLPDMDLVKVHVLARAHVRQMLIPLWRYLKRERPDVVFSAEDHLNAVLLLGAIGSGSRAKISCSSRVTPFDTYSHVPFTKRWYLKHMMRAVMWRANVLTCVSQDMVAQYRQVFESARHVHVYNIVDDGTARRRMQEPVEHQWFVRRDAPLLVAAGRLAPWKGFADLIHAVKQVSQRRPVRLAILGDGPLRAELQMLIEELGLRDVVWLEGYVDNPLRFFSRADVFVLSSHVEGLPNVLVEAMMCGCTPVATDCPTGPREVLGDGRYGYLVPVRDPSAMAVAIEKALDNPIPKALLEEAVGPFGQDAVVGRHLQLLGFDATELAPGAGE